MLDTIDDVIERCKNGYGLVVVDQNTGIQEGIEENKSKFVDFVVRHLKAHPDYNLNQRTKNNNHPYKTLMSHILFLFSIMDGQTPVIAGYMGHTEEKRMQSVMDLYLLRPAELGAIVGGDREAEASIKKHYDRLTDERLFSLYTSFAVRHYRNHNFPNWGSAINDLGTDKEVFNHLTQDEEKVRAFEETTNIKITDYITYQMVLKCHSPNPLTFGHGGPRWGARKS